MGPEFVEEVWDFMTMSILFAPLVPTVMSLGIMMAPLPITPAEPSPEPEVLQLAQASDIDPSVDSSKAEEPMELSKEVSKAPILRRLEDEAESAPATPATAIETETPVTTQMSDAVKEVAPSSQQVEALDELELIDPEQALRPVLSREEILERAGERLQDIRNARGSFVQTDNYGERSEGTFYLRRPGRIRFEYGSPPQLLVISDGSTVSVEDLKLETIDRAPLAATPLKLFLGRNVDLSKDANVVDVQSVGGVHMIAVEDRRSSGDERIDGQMMLIFDRDSFDFLGWVAVDGAGNQIRIDLFDLEVGYKANAELFLLENDEDDDRRR